MKKIISQTTVLLLVLAGGFASCAKGNTDKINFHEITIDSANPVITFASNGIEFNFCLLNEQGEPSTIFNEGENFRFYFKCTNHNANKELEFDGDFLSYLIIDGLGCVISQQNDTIGYPCKFGFGTDIFATYPFYGENNSYEVIIPWSDSRERWSDNLSRYYESLHRENLSTGKYYTGFTHEFRFFVKGKHGRYDITVSFKINFEVK
jgi:hypothetical protein